MCPVQCCDCMDLPGQWRRARGAGSLGDQGRPAKPWGGEEACQSRYTQTGPRFSVTASLLSAQTLLPSSRSIFPRIFHWPGLHWPHCYPPHSATARPQVRGALGSPHTGNSTAAGHAADWGEQLFLETYFCGVVCLLPITTAFHLKRYLPPPVLCAPQGG